MPRISAVIPVLGRHDALAAVLDGLCRQEGIGADALELVLVADAAEPEPERLRRLAAGRHPQARVLRARRPGASAARNVGWSAAEAPLILFLGADILPSAGLVASHLRAHGEHPQPESAVLGLIEWADHLRVTPFMRWLDEGVQFDYGSIRGEMAGWAQLYSSNSSLKRSMLERVGGFDEDRFPFLYEDLDLGRRLRDHGLRVWFERSARAGHDHAPTLDQWRRRMALVAVAERTWVRVHPDQPAYFHAKFTELGHYPPARGRGRHLARLIPRRVPGVGPYLWRSLDLYYRQQLAPAFLAAWEEAGQGEGASSAGAPPAGPK